MSAAAVSVVAGAAVAGAGSVLPHYSRDAPTIGVIVMSTLVAAVVVALLIARRRR